MFWTYKTKSMLKRSHSQSIWPSTAAHALSYTPGMKKNVQTLVCSHWCGLRLSFAEKLDGGEELSSMKFWRETTEFWLWPQASQAKHLVALNWQANTNPVWSKKESRWATSIWAVPEKSASANRWRPSYKTSHSHTAEGCVVLSRARSDSEEASSEVQKKQRPWEKEILVSL